MHAARFLSIAAAIALCGCSRPEPPTITPLSGRVASISPTGLTVEATLEGNNPNDFDLSLRSFTAQLTLDGKYDIGTVTAPHRIDLPANKKKTFQVPIAFRWHDVVGLAPLALSNRDVPYTADGRVKVTAGSVELEVPFKVSGVVTHQQIVEAVGRSLPRIPGLPF